MKQHVIARRFEQKLADELGGRRIFLSGAGSEKADIRVRRTYKSSWEGVGSSERMALRIEAKTTSRPTYTFKVQDWLDVARAAAQAGETPVFAIQFADPMFGGASYVLTRVSTARLLGHPLGALPKLIKSSCTFSALGLLRNEERRHLLWERAAQRDPGELVLHEYTEFRQLLEQHNAEGD